MKLAAALCFLCLGGAAQPGAAPSFDVASVKRLPPGTPHGGSEREVTPTSLTLRNASLGNCIYWAYGYQHWEVIGPNWRDYPTDAVYNIVGKTAEPVSESEMKLRLRTLLKERLGLAFHREPRETPVYALIVDRSGLKLRKSESTGDVSIKFENWSQKIQRISMADFAKMMDPPFTSRHVVDETGLSGIYDFTLNLAPYVLDPETGKPVLDNRGAIDMEGALILALPKQLGLRLDRQTAMLEVMVIDHVEKEPTAN